MPIEDIVEVEVDLAPKAGARASLGIGLMLHVFNDDQDALFPAGNRLARVDESTWEDTLAGLGISAGEPAWNDVAAHFGQPNKPSYGFVGRRGQAKGTQTKTITIAEDPDSAGDAIDGLYRLSDIEGGPYESTASGSTVTVHRDAWLVVINAGTHPTFTAVANGTDAIDLVAATGGENIPVTLTAPDGGAILAITASAKEVKTAQEQTVTFQSGADGMYTVNVSTSTGQKQYQWTEGSGTGTGATQAATFKALFDADPSDLVTAPLAAPAGGTVTMSAATAGTPVTLDHSSPLSDIVVQVTEPNWNILDDIRAAQEEGGFYYVINGSHDRVDLEQGAAAIETERLGHVVQSSDADIRQPVDTDVFSALKAGNYGRTMGVEHPLNAEGVHAGWCGDWATDQPGQVTLTAIVLNGLTAQVFNPKSAAANIRGKEGSYLERFEARGQDVILGGYAFSGRPFDLYRALDTFCANVETALADTMIVNRTIPYDEDGLAFTEQAIRTEWDRAVSTGYGVTLELEVPPDIPSTTTPDEQIRGIQPAFTGHAVFQVGSYKLRANFTVSQIQE